MKKMILALAFLISIIVTQKIDAADAFYECNNCSAYQYKQTAYKVIPNNAYYGWWDVYVVDVVNNKLKRYDVSLETDPAFPRGFVQFALERTPEPYYLNQFNNLIASYNELKSLTKNEKTFDYPNGSAYDLRGGNNRAFETAVNNYIWDTGNAWFSFQAYAGSFINLLGSVFTDDLNLNVYIDFPDGTSVEMRLAGIGEDGEVVFEYNPDSATDADGNRIPDTSEAFANHYGTYNTDDSINDFLRLAASYGIPITNGGGSGGKYVVECSTSKGKMTCVLRRIER
jgi:hypothetical protein